MTTLADLIQIAADEGTDPKDINLVFQADAESDTEPIELLDDPSCGNDPTMKTTFILTTQMTSFWITRGQR